MSTIRQALQSALDQNGGAIAFDEFMRIALHDPQHGYYARNIRGIGRSGDFTTAPKLTPALGDSIAGWLKDEAAARGWKTFNIIECGPGDGSLARQVLQSLGWFARRRVSLHLVETSGPLREAQRKHLRATWHETIGDALRACEGRALIYHNEFFDVFPCRVFKKQADQWLELHLRVRDGHLAEDWIARTLPDSNVLEKLWPDGQRVDVFASVRSWLQEVAVHWREGVMLAIDYGGTAQSIYHRRPNGTLRAYRQQQRLEGPSVYEIPGRQDITADVNFEDLSRWTAELGWTVASCRALSNFAPEAPGGEAFHCLTLLA